MSVTKPDHLVHFFGTIQNGKVVSPEPIDLPDGTAVRITTPDKTQAAEDDGWDNSPEGIADWLKWLDSLKPLVFTEQEKQAWEIERLSRKEWEKQNFDEEAEKLRRMWE